MVYKMVHASEKAAGRTAGNAHSNAAMISDELTARWRKRLRPEQKYVDVHQLQVFLARDLRAACHRLLEAVDFHLNRLAEIRELRQQRDEVKSVVRDLLHRLYKMFESNHGELGADLLFSQAEEVPTDPVPLRRLGRHVVENLRRTDLALPPALFEGGVKFDREDLARQLEKPVDRLDAVLLTLEETLPLANQSLEEKHKAHDALDKLNAQAARFLEAFYVLAGHDILATTVRRSSHRAKKALEASKKQETAATETAPEPAPAAAPGAPAKAPPGKSASAAPAAAPAKAPPETAAGPPGRSVLPWPPAPRAAAGPPAEPSTSPEKAEAAPSSGHRTEGDTQAVELDERQTSSRKGDPPPSGGTA